MLEQITSLDLFDKSMTALEIFDKGLTKSAIKLMANGAIENVLEKGSVLQAAEVLSVMETFVKEIKADERFKNYTREETAKYPKGFISASGAKIELTETGTVYNFDKCGDVELEILEANLMSAENSLKERKEFLKKIPLAGIDVIVPYSGEVIHIYPPSKSSTSSYKITLAK